MKPTTLDEVLTHDDVCPMCLGELDPGWECTQCGFDALYLMMSEEIETALQNEMKK